MDDYSAQGLLAVNIDAGVACFDEEHEAAEILSVLEECLPERVHSDFGPHRDALGNLVEQKVVDHFARSRVTGSASFRKGNDTRRRVTVPMEAGLHFIVGLGATRQRRIGVEFGGLLAYAARIYEADKIVECGGA